MTSQIPALIFFLIFLTISDAKRSGQECQFTFSNESYVETRGRFPLFSRDYNGMHYTSFLFFFKITPTETKTETKEETKTETKTETSPKEKNEMADKTSNERGSSNMQKQHDAASAIHSKGAVGASGSSSGKITSGSKGADPAAGGAAASGDGAAAAGRSTGGGAAAGGGGAAASGSGAAAASGSSGGGAAAGGGGAAAAGSNVAETKASGSSGGGAAASGNGAAAASGSSGGDAAAGGGGAAAAGSNVAETKAPEKHPQTVLELYDNRRSGGKVPQFLVQVQPFRLYVWGCQLTTAEGGDIKGADLKPGKEHLVKLLLKASEDMVGNHYPVGVHLKINDFDFRGQLRTGGGCTVYGKTDTRELKLHVHSTVSDPHFRLGGQKNQQFTSKKFKVSYPSSPLEAKVTYLWFYLGINDLKIPHGNGRPFPQAREEMLSDDTLGENEGWNWNAENTLVKAQSCPGGSGLPTTTTSTTMTTITKPLPTTTTTTTTTKPPPPTEVLKTDYPPMVEEYENNAPHAEETETDEFLEGDAANPVQAKEKENKVKVGCGVGCIVGCIVGIVVLLLIVVIVVVVVVMKRRGGAGVASVQNKNQNRSRTRRKGRKSKALYRALEAPNLIEEVTSGGEP